MANTERASTDSLDVSRGTEGGQGRAGQGAGSGIESGRMWAATGRCMAIKMQPVSLELIWKLC